MNGEAQQAIDFLQRNWRVLLVIAIIIVLIWLFSRSAVLARLFGRETPPNLNCGQGSLSTTQHKSIATSVYTSISGWNFSPKPVESAFEKLLGLSIPDLCSVHNAYKNKYAADDYPTLRALLEQEFITYPTLLNMRSELYNRLSSIGA